MHCVKCGQEESPFSKVCVRCGGANFVDKNNVPSGASNAAPESLPAVKFANAKSANAQARPERVEDQYDEFIGDGNADRYLAKFQQFDRHRAAGLSWHWPAFFITFYWLVYRKMWGLATVYMLIPIAFAFAFALIFHTVPSFGAMAVVVAVGFFVPALFADALYYKACRRRIQAARAQTRDPLAQRRQIARRGGTSPIAVIVVIVLQLVLGLATRQMAPDAQSRVAAEVAR